MKLYFGYIRVSDRKQEKGVSLEVQKSDIEKFALQRGYDITAWFVEVQTAAKAGRGVFTGMLARLEKGEAQGVIIHKIDRGARNLEDWNNLSKLFDRGLDVQFAHEPIDLHTRGGRLSADILAVVAADFIRNNRQEAKKGFYGRLEQGVYPLPAPIGYLDKGAGIPKVVDPARAPLVRHAFELYARNTVGLKELRRVIARLGLRTKNGKVPSLNAIAQMLHNPFYIGIIHIKRANRNFQGKHPALVSKATFDRVQAILAGKTVLRSAKHEFLFRRRVRCGQCGLHLVGERQKGKYIYYRCHSESCTGTSIREEVIADVVQKQLQLLIGDEVELRDFRDLVEVERKNVTEEKDKLRASLSLRLEKCDDRISRLTDAYIDQLIDKETFEARKQGLLGERRNLLDQIENLTIADLPMIKAFKKLELANAAYSGYISGNIPEQHSIIDQVTSNLSVHRNNPAIKLKSPYQEIVDWRKSQSGGPRRGVPRTRARELLDILMMVDQVEISAAVPINRAA